MSQFARVITLDVLRDVKAAFVSFAEDATVSLSEAQSDVQRTIWWIQHDQLANWQRELKKRNEKLSQAKTELFRKQLESNDTRTSAVVERKAVQKWQAAVEEAEDKIRKVKKWSIQIEREFMLFKAQLQQVAGAVAGEIPSAIARVEKMMDSLHAYVSLQAPTLSTPSASISSAEEEVVSEDSSAEKEGESK